VPTKTQRDNDPQNPILSAVRESQTALVDVVRSWTDITEQLTRNVPLPVAGFDVVSAVDRGFDLAEQTLAAYRQFTLTLVGVVDRQVDTAVETVESSARESLRGVEDLLSEAESLPTGKPEAEKTEARKLDTKQDTKPDRRGYEDRGVEELRDRARELDIEGRTSMSKDELIAALRDHRQRRSAKKDAPKSQPPRQERTPDRRTYEERNIEELRERARELEIEGRSTMSKDELVAALRQHAK
jgi:hypothetical protein